MKLSRWIAVALLAASLGQVLAQEAEIRKNLMAQLSRRIVGQHAVIDQMLTALFSKGHCRYK